MSVGAHTTSTPVANQSHSARSQRLIHDDFDHSSDVRHEPTRTPDAGTREPTHPLLDIDALADRLVAGDHHRSSGARLAVMCAVTHILGWRAQSPKSTPPSNWLSQLDNVQNAQELFNMAWRDAWCGDPVSIMRGVETLLRNIRLN
jgi:hypothetical protein